MNAQDCSHPAMRPDDDAYQCPHCGTEMPRHGDVKGYIAAARAHLKPKDPTTKGPR